MTDIDGTTPPAAPPSVEDVPLEDGAFVELHSLKREDMNGSTGEVVGFDEGAQRHQVLLDSAPNKTILIKPDNLRRIPLVSSSVKMEAFKKANHVNGKVQTAHQNQDPQFAAILSQAREVLQQCIDTDRLCVVAHACLGQCATMVRD